MEHAHHAEKSVAKGHPAHPHEHHKLGQVFATAICGNDIMSSCLYVSAIAILFSGVYAPIILLMIGIVLFCYKKVYTEVVEALPVNGGAYNCLLNATSKTVAAFAGVMTFLSYIATAVISAKVGVEYLHTILPEGVEHFFMGFGLSSVIVLTILLLLAFALLVIGGIKDSAKVAFIIFATHIFTLIAFVALGVIYLKSGGQSFMMENIARTDGLIADRGSLPTMLFLAFSASLLGVSGFESSANFVEEQKRGVFRKTLRNMLVGVVIFNPLIALVVLFAMPYEAITQNTDYLLSNAATIIGGTWFQYLVVIDAFLVLSGAVLTSYVGVSGLLNRMSSDNCLPNYFNKMNGRGSFPRIIMAFFLLCSSILIITKGNLLSLAGVYTIAFLGVMTMFAFGNLILKEARKDLKRTYRAPVIFVIIALFSTLAGMIGNAFLDPRNLMFFSVYFFPTIIVVLAIIYQDVLVRLLLRTTHWWHSLQRYIKRHYGDMTDGKFIVFIHHASRLAPALEYLARNETGLNVTLVCCREEDGSNGTHYDEIREALPHLKTIGLHPEFNIDLIYKDKPFGPEIIEEVSQELGVRKNRIMIGSIHQHHHFDYDELGGVRIIFG